MVVHAPFKVSFAGPLFVSLSVESQAKKKLAGQYTNGTINR